MRSMKTCWIQLKSPQEIQDFVRLVNDYPFPVDLVSHNYRVDAKSIMGIFSFRFTEPVLCEIGSDDCAELLCALAPFCPNPNACDL